MTLCNCSFARSSFAVYVRLNALPIYPIRSCSSLCTDFDTCQHILPSRYRFHNFASRSLWIFLRTSRQYYHAYIHSPIRRTLQRILLCSFRSRYPKSFIWSYPKRNCFIPLPTKQNYWRASSQRLRKIPNPNFQVWSNHYHTSNRHLFHFRRPSAE